MKKTVCMVVQNKMVKGGIAAVISGYYGSELEEKYHICYVESYMDGGKFVKLLKGFIGYCVFAKTLILNKPELVHIHSSFGPSFYRKLPFIYMASWAKVPVINHIHGADFEAFYRGASEKKKRLVKRVYNKCHTLIALSEEWKDRLSEIVPADKITVIENYSVLKQEAAAEKMNRPSNHTVLFLGELGKRKGCYDIPDIILETAKQVPDVRFVLAGAGSKEDEMAIRKMLQKKNVANHVIFPGWIRGDERERWLNDADLFLLPSYNEGMPMSILDAMGYGLPIISTNVGGIPKIVHDGENGICCNPGDINTMTEGIIELLTDDQKRYEASKASIDFVRKSYSLESHIEKLETLYEEVIQSANCQ